MAGLANCFTGATAIGIFAVLAATSPAPLCAQNPERGGTLTIARPDEPLTFDPFLPSDNGSITAIAQICEPLLLADASGSGLEPGLASSWTVSQDRLSYVLSLRKGVKFSDGNPMTADDVVFSLKKAMEREAPYSFAFAAVRSVEKIDASRVQVTLKTFYAPLVSVLSLFSGSIVEKDAYLRNPDAFGVKPVCTGPFVVESYERGDRVVLAPNLHYWRMGLDGKPLPYLDRVVLKYIPDNNARILELRGGTADVALNVPFNLASMVKSMKGISLEVSRSYRLDYVYLNHSRRPLDDKRIRLAMNYAANRAAMLKVVYFGYGEIPNSFTPKVNFWSANVERIPYDLKKAAALVKEANYDGTPIHVLVDNGNTPSRQIATILQSAWTAIGLKVDIVQYDGGTAFNMVEKGEYQAYVSTISSDINDSDEMATLEGDSTGATNGFFSWYRNAAVMALLAEARRTSDSTDRAALYTRVQDLVYHDGYSVPLNFLPYVNAYRSKVQNWRTIMVGWWWLDQVWIQH